MLNIVQIVFCAGFIGGIIMIGLFVIDTLLRAAVFMLNWKHNSKVIERNAIIAFNHKHYTSEDLEGLPVAFIGLDSYI